MRHCRLLLMVTLSGGLHAAVNVKLYHPHDFVFRAKVTGNPFDVAVGAEVTGPNAVRMRIPGFYDGDGEWKVRFSPIVTVGGLYALCRRWPDLTASRRRS